MSISVKYAQHLNYMFLSFDFESNFDTFRLTFTAPVRATGREKFPQQNGKSDGQPVDNANCLNITV